MLLIDAIRQLEEDGAIREQCPEPMFWRWLVLHNIQPLPPWARDMMLSYGEIRWYPGKDEVCEHGYRKPCRCHDWSPEERAEYDAMYD